LTEEDGAACGDPLAQALATLKASRLKRFKGGCAAARGTTTGHLLHCVAIINAKR